jgi:hypothetical protein
MAGWKCPSGTEKRRAEIGKVCGATGQLVGGEGFGFEAQGAVGKMTETKVETFVNRPGVDQMLEGDVRQDLAVVGYTRMLENMVAACGDKLRILLKTETLWRMHAWPSPTDICRAAILLNARRNVDAPRGARLEGTGNMKKTGKLMQVLAGTMTVT